ncbi:MULTISPECIES: hypothetical protein [Corynebacterium]|uniref:hypothetical protein n=1 Tax=Corynebacterium TaxID=1716 RepID=UPI0008A654A6|nr:MULTISPECIES: hypothetical protein [Corynebacterium]OFL24480.1 hypothetical protein HMPREF2781_02870 [Corynebacterium sp. HMSC062A03]OFS36356.1 hypothetical protein HMPREF2896_00150 [Corynebacterium sp. HMSC069E04]OFT65737.1 hypothetical protein HMPREF3147_06795 [Corynebacterium sp. HMSC05D03]QQU95527.1 hypothetical protein I6I66_12460 [Corynebacterium aurimucosum]UTA71575.1 hypothetical protein J3S22_00215 [Corynebacterium aurimucosum]
MTKRRRTAGLIAGLAIAGTALIAPAASAATQTESYPETPAVNAKLPIVHTSHGSDHMKANVLNPRPVCNPWEDHRTVVYKVTDNFMPAGTISTTNQTKKDIPLQQDLSKSQSITLSVNGDRTETTSMNAGGKGSGKNSEGSFGVSHEIATKLGASASYSLSWEAGQSIGPYDVPPNHTGEATYGFRVLNMTGTQQYCKPNGTWSTPTFWSAMQPMKNEVRVKLYDDIADSYAPNKDAQNTTDVNDPKVVEEEKSPEADAEVIKDNEVAPEEKAVSEAEGKKEEEADKKVQEDLDNGKTDEAKQKLDLKPVLTTSGAKHAGFAGTVALRLENVGTERYYGDFPAVQYRVDVKTAEGPKGVDRLITPRSSNGAHIRDLGFDEKTSTRSFEVTLANPINAGESARVANLDFGDGNTKEGRLKNYIEVTQISRLKGDNSTDNDQNVDSREITVKDTGKKAEGLF